MNSNSEIITTALANTLALDGTAPNQMQANLDMNNNSILNLPAPTNQASPIRLMDVSTLNGGGTITAYPLPTGGTTGQVLAKTDNGNYDVNWVNPAAVVTTGSSSLALTGNTLSTVALTGDVTSPANSFSTTISNNAVTAAKFRASAPLAVVGNNTNGLANVSDITGTANQILSVNSSGSSLGFVNVGGDLANTNGTLTVQSGAITGAKIATNTIANSNIAQGAAATFIGNPTATTANQQNFTIAGLPNLASPAANLDLVPIYNHTTGAINYSTAGQIAGSNTAGVSSINATTGAFTTGYGITSTSTVLNVSTQGALNKLRNSSQAAWFHGASGTTTISGGFTSEGIYVVPTGASVTWARQASGLTSPLTYYSTKITGASSCTDVKVRFVIESYDAATFAGQNVLIQIPVLNNTGGTITPTISTKYPTAQDNYASSTADLSSTSLQSITNGSTGVLSLCFATSANANNGYSITIDFGNNFSSNSKSIQIGGGYDLRLASGISTGLVSSPPSPEILRAYDDITWCQRFYASTYDNGTAPGTASAPGIMQYGAVSSIIGLTFTFPVTMRAQPTISYWDFAGNASAYSFWGAGAWNNNVGTISTILTGTKSWLATVTASDEFAAHFTADATIAGA